MSQTVTTVRRKVHVSFIPLVAAMLAKTYGTEAADRIQGACQGAANDPKIVTATDKGQKRSAVNGGRRYDDKGELNIRDLKWKSTDTTEYVAKDSAPIELIKWNDNVARLFSLSGAPSEAEKAITPALMPTYLREWCEGIAKRHKEQKKAEKQAGKPGLPKPTREMSPMSPSNGNGHAAGAAAGAAK